MVRHSLAVATVYIWAVEDVKPILKAAQQANLKNAAKNMNEVRQMSCFMSVCVCAGTLFSVCCPKTVFLCVCTSVYDTHAHTLLTLLRLPGEAGQHEESNRSQ